MSELKSSKNESGSNDGLALIVGGLFVLALVFATYSYFNRTDDMEKVSGASSERINEEGEDESKNELSLGERIKELFNSQKGDLNGEGTSVEKTEVVEEETEVDKNLQVLSYSSEQWVANDYQDGDISGNTYTVTDGDTLWEIAEARYGNGADWTKILEANSSDIGYLANGQQALIVPGQVITLP